MKPGRLKSIDAVVQPVVAALVGLFLVESMLSAQELKIECADGMQLDAIIDLQNGVTDDQVDRVVILVHGSGSQSMDSDLSAVTRNKKPNLFFRDLGTALAESGFAVVRYHKRNYQLGLMLRDKSAEQVNKDQYVATFRENPLRFLVNDVLSAVELASNRFPNAGIYLLGHSQGTYVALQAASQDHRILGTGLIGFAEYSTDTLVFVQTVYRPLHLFAEIDSNSDDLLDEAELSVDHEVANSLKQARSLIDFDKDGLISRSEFQAGNLANLLVHDTFAPYRKQEAEYPRVAEILKSAKFKVAFFQGMLDNQTPAYHTMAFDLLLNQMGKAGNMRFHYFPGLGHALDHRESYQDSSFSQIDPEALAKIVAEVNGFFIKSDD